MSVFLQFLRQFNGTAEIPQETVPTQSSEASSEFQQMLFELMTSNEQQEIVPSDIVEFPLENKTAPSTAMESVGMRVENVLQQTEGDSGESVKSVHRSSEKHLDAQISISKNEIVPASTFAQNIVPIQQGSENTNVSFQTVQSFNQQHSVTTKAELPIVPKANSIVLSEFSQQQKNVPTIENKEVSANNKRVENVSSISEGKQQVQQQFFSKPFESSNSAILQTVVENTGEGFSRVENVNIEPKGNNAELPHPSLENRNVRFVQQPTIEQTQVMPDDAQQHHVTFVAAKESVQNLPLAAQVKTNSKDMPKVFVHQNIARNSAEQSLNVTVENIVLQNGVNGNSPSPKELQTSTQLLSSEKPASSQTRDVLTELKKLETSNVHTTAFVKESSVQHASTISIQTPAAILKETMENALPKKTTIANKKHNEVAIEPTTLNATEKNEIKFSETIKPVETKLVNESKIVSENISKNFEQKKNSDTNIATSLNPENATEKQLSSTSGKTIVDEPIFSGKESTQPKHSQQNFVRNDGGEVSNRMQDIGTQRNEIQPRYSNALSHEWAKHVIEDVSKSAMIKVTEQLSEIRLRLHPEHLGELVLSVKSEGEKMSANILVNSFEVKRALETNMPVLHDALMLRGIEMKKIDVNENTNAQQQFRHNNDAQTGHQNRQQRPNDEERAKQFARYFGYNTMEYTV